MVTIPKDNPPGGHVTTNLRPMSEQEWGPIRAESIQLYAARHVTAGRWSEEEALEEATKEYDRLLPQGVTTEHHHLYVVLESEDDSPVGYMWYEVRHAETTPLVFVCDLRIFEPHRRKGHAKTALTILESLARKDHGARRIGLHVFGDNLPARRLYEQAGFGEKHVLMAKDLSEEPARRG